MKMQWKWMTVVVVLAGILSAQADPILWDFNFDDRASGLGTVSNFIDLGVSEDLTGATVSQINGLTNSTMTDGVISLSYVSGFAFGVTGEHSTNSVLTDYLYIQAGEQGAGPVIFQISGLNAVLAGDTTYSFYLIGAGNAADQGSQFVFNGVTNFTTSAATDLEAAVKFSFTTDSIVADTLDFTWSRIESNTWSALNGFAIAAIPEPATFGLMAAFGVILILARRWTALF